MIRAIGRPPRRLEAWIRRHWTEWYEWPIAGLEHRDAIREQAIGVRLCHQRLEATARYEVHLDRKLERMLAMLIRLRELRQPAARRDPFGKIATAAPGKGGGTIEGARSLDVMKLARAGYLSGSWAASGAIRGRRCPSLHPAAVRHQW